MSALADPLRFGLDVVMQEVLTLLKRGLRAQRPLGPRVSPTWSLHEVLYHITFKGMDELSKVLLLQTAIFLFPWPRGFGHHS